jgi:hypothetical protein
MSTMQFRRAGSSSSRTAGAASSSGTRRGVTQELCPFCRVKLVRIRSKQPETYGKMFLKCPYSVKVSEVVFNLGSILSCMYGFDGSRV